MLYVVVTGFAISTVFNLLTVNSAVVLLAKCVSSPAYSARIV